MPATKTEALNYCSTHTTYETHRGQQVTTFSASYNEDGGRLFAIILAVTDIE
jgi:hypothetical protein